MKSKLITFEGDTFHADGIAAVTVDEKTVYIYIGFGHYNEFEYEFDNETIAQSKKTAFVSAWEKSINESESPTT